MNYDPADNSRKCYDLALACLREVAVRRWEVEPIYDYEHRWRAEGPVRNEDLESLKEKTNDSRN